MIWTQKLLTVSQSEKKRYMRNTSDEKYGDYITCQSTFETKSREVGLFELNCSKKPAFRGVSRTPTVI